MFIAEVEYISAASCCTQLLWTKHQLKDYQINANNIPIFCDNTVVICLSKNPILHSRAKHIEIKHHFIRDYVQKGILDIQFIDTEHQWANIFTKPLTIERFNFIKKNLNMHFLSDWNCLLLNWKLGSEVTSEAMVHQKLLTEILRKICFWRWHQHFNFSSWILCFWITKLVELLGLLLVTPVPLTWQCVWSLLTWLICIGVWL